ncbi:phage tail tape measure protein [Eubacterium callanderi]|uniref:Phage related protein n=2 Tax=root TaxID=1 RepID=E3GLR6_9FIRM|nr:phage tail tape measure protein [Eubacterium callanderi]OEZ06663.1 murein DD-endopeptidase MepM [[Butyribacterium] methylotrophicum]DAE12859.1 MAG TPA: minor tail protein [Siphoviridae sp. ctcC24]ADO36293.1 phage related protein [Eubacterium callanderi]AEU12278.1 Phage tail length tape-measure protein [Eubacterium callanderi]MCB6661407.1 phage tail tape measure protein [Eubacterium callanderi]
MATKSLNIKLSVDANQFTSSMGKVNANLRLLKSDLAATTGNVALFGNNLDGLKSKSINLNQQIDQQWKKINLLTEAYQKSAKENGETAEQTQKYERQLNYANAQLSKMQTELADTNTKIREQENSFIQAGNKLQEFSDKAGNVSKTLEKAGAKATTHITLPIIGIGTASVNTAMKFDDSMSQVAGALDKPVDQMNDLRQLALDMGESTIFSASECGQAMTELAKGGLSEADIQAGALQSTMDLAASSGMELGNAANTVVQAMGAFGLTAEQSSQAVNALAGAAAASSTDVEPLTQGLAQCAAQAFNAGWSIQDTTAALGAFADAGITGSDAGTSLKTMLQRLAAPTDAAATMLEQLGINTRDANGNMLSATDMAEELQSKMGQLDSATRDAALSTIFGSDATRAATVFMNTGAEGLKKYTAATNDQEVASRLANAQMSDASRNFEELKGALETAGIAIGETLLPTVTDLVKEGTELIQAFNKLDDGAKKNVANMALLAAGIGPVLSIAGKTTAVVKGLTGGIGKLTEKLGKAQVESKGLNSGLGLLTKSFGVTGGAAGKAATAFSGVSLGAVGIAAAIPAVLAGLGMWYQHSVNVRDGSQAIIDKAQGVIDKNNELTTNIQANIEQRQASLQSINDEVTANQGLTDQLFKLNEQYGGTAEAKTILQPIIDELNQRVQGLNLTLDEETGILSLTRDEINKIIEAYKEENRQYELREQHKQVALDLAEAEKIYSEAVSNCQSVQDQQNSVLKEIEEKYANVRGEQERSKLIQDEYAWRTLALTDQQYANIRAMDEAAQKVNGLRDEQEELISQINSEPVKAAEHVKTEMYKAGGDAIQKYIEGAIGKAPDLNRTSDQISRNAAGAASAGDVKLTWSTSGWNLGDAFRQGLLSTGGMYSQTARDVAQSGSDAAKSKEQEYRGTGGLLGRIFGDGLRGQKPDANAAGLEIANESKNGLNAGMTDWEEVKRNTENLASKVGEWFKSVLGINSPSTVFRGYGVNVLQGFINGLGEIDIRKIVTNLSLDVLNAFENGQLGLDTFLEALGGGMNGINAFIDFARSNLGEGMSGILDRLAGSFFTGAGNSAVAMTGGLLWPSDYSEITSWFGARPASDTNGIGSTNHGGLDIGAPYGAPIYSAGAGTVTLADWYGGYGNTVMIALDNGFTTLFGHMSSIGVSAGDRVAPGQIVGLVGSTGNSTGPHLHYSIFLNGQPIDPAQFYGFDVGSRRIPFDMPAMVHKDEMIVPARENPYVNSGGSILGGLFDGLDQRIAAAVAQALGGSGERKVEINQVFTDANPSPSEIERKTLNAMRKAALLGL